MKTVQDLIDAYREGKKPILKVIGRVEDEFELDPGCLLKITGYLGEKGGYYAFRYDFDEFKSYNRKFLRKTWFLPYTGGLGTAEEFGAWEKKDKILCFCEPTTSLLSDYDLEYFSTDAREVIEAEIKRLEEEIPKLETELSEYKKILAELKQETGQ
jgi:hypothetical protein